MPPSKKENICLLLKNVIILFYSEFSQDFSGFEYFLIQIKGYSAQEVGLEVYVYISLATANEDQKNHAKISF